LEYRKLGTSGLQLSAIALGAWATIGERLGRRETTALLHTAYELGINYFDNAETYADGASESVMGEALVELGWPRESFVVSSKVFWGTHGKRPNTWGLSRKHVLEGCHASLRRLQLDHLDLLLCHRNDPNTPLVETVCAMSDLVTQGKIVYWGTSEWPAEEVVAARRIAEQHGMTGPVVEQLQYNMLVRDRVELDFKALAGEGGLGITTWSPLAYGLFTGRYDNGIAPAAGRLGRPEYSWLHEVALGDAPEQTLHAVRMVNAFALDLGTTPSRLALAWVLGNPLVCSAISGASSPEQVAENVRALDVVSIVDDHVRMRIDELMANWKSCL
jgi:voltage-dependent potassium channel beta subunit